MQHIILATGDTRWSPREDVDHRPMHLLVDHIAAGFRGPTDVPDHPDFQMQGAQWRNVLVATVSRAGTALVTIGVVPTDGDAMATAWILGGSGALAAPGPWCLVRIHPGLALTQDEAVWLGNYECCLAWAWLESGPGAIACGRCNHSSSSG